MEATNTQLKALAFIHQVSSATFDRANVKKFGEVQRIQQERYVPENPESTQVQTQPEPEAPTQSLLGRYLDISF
jgi:hypothetical protein